MKTVAITPPTPFDGMTSKQVFAHSRIVNLDMWLARQPLSPKTNSILEQSISFRKKLNEWADNPDTTIIAPTFPLAPI